MDFKDKAYIVTGASSGMSRCTVTLPIIVANTGYDPIGWGANGATTGALEGSSYEINTNNSTLYANAADRTLPLVSFNPNSSATYAKTASVTVTVTDAESKVKGGQSIKYRWQTSSTCSTTAGDYTSTAALSTTSTASTSATATATSSGLNGTYYLCVYSGIKDVYGN